MQGFKSWLHLSAAAMLLAAGVALAQVPGKDFQTINPPQPTDTGNKVEVLEFFSYGCPHCHSLQSPLHAWLKRKPADVDFKRMPAVFQESWVPLARLYFTVEAMGALDTLHRDVFTAIHTQKMKLQDPKVLFDWVATKGVDKQKFTDTYNSFSVQSRTQRAADVTRRYDIQFTPAVVVNGHYLTGPSMTSTGNAVDYDRFFKVLDHLIATARKETKGK
jgi:protein dithiol oxidoreductase (disulfide-forming)